MSIASRLSSAYQFAVCRPVAVVLVCLAASISSAPFARAQAAAPPTELDRILSHVDLDIIGAGFITGNSAGTVQSPAVFQQSVQPSSTFGLVATARYTVKPLLGVEFNYGYARYTNNFLHFTVPITSTTCASITCADPEGVQTRANEYTVGYVAHLPTFFGWTPTAAAGVGSTGFTPTAHGGESLRAQARATYYYSFGVEQTFLSKHFGLRAQFRQSFYKAPDFGQNYLTIQQHTSTIEPGAGFFFRF
jgi:Outer membrane protein beta-barrel domain